VRVVSLIRQSTRSEPWALAPLSQARRRFLVLLQACDSRASVAQWRSERFSIVCHFDLTAGILWVLSGLIQIIVSATIAKMLRKVGTVARPSTSICLSHPVVAVRAFFDPGRLF
jgi:hypothetical protein